MPVTGVFNADFSSFYTAVTKADQQLQALEATTAKTNAVSKDFGDHYQKIDGILASAGVNISPYVKGLDDIASMAGKTAKELGFLGTAAAGAGAFMLGMKVGEQIDAWTGWSTAIEKATASLMGWGTAAQTAGAVQDTINLALKNGAAAGISYTDAIKFNAAAMAQQQAAQRNWAGELATAQKEVRGLTEAQRADIAIMQEAGAKTTDITTKYNISALALKQLAKEEDLAAESRKKATKITEEKAAAEAKLSAEYAKLMSETKNLNQLAIMDAEAAKMAKAKSDAAAGWFNELQKTIKATNEAAAAEKARVDQNQQEIDAILAKGAAHTEAGAAAAAGASQAVRGYQQVAQQITITGEAVKEWINLMKYTAEVNAILSSGSGLFTTQSQRERIAGLGGPSLPASAPLGGGGGQQVFNNTFQIVDTESNIAKKVSDNIMRQVKAGTQLGTA